MWWYTVSLNWVSVLLHCRWLVSHPGVRQQYKATLFVFSDEYVGTRLYCWSMSLESRWAVKWETVSQTWWCSSQKRAEGNSGKKSRQKGKHHCFCEFWEGKKESAFGRREKRMRLHPDVLLFEASRMKSASCSWEPLRSKADPKRTVRDGAE